MKVQVGILSHQPMENPLLERCINNLIRIPAGIDYDIVLQFSKGSHAENWNRLFKRCTADLVCILEDDTAPLKPFWLRSLMQTMMLKPDAAIVMPIETKDGRTPDPGFKKWLDITTKIPFTYGFCNLIRRDAELVADEKLKYFVDIDLALQAHEQGWSCYVNGHTWMLHGSEKEHSDRLCNEPKIKELQKDDHEYIETKWKHLMSKLKGEFERKEQAA